MSNLAENCIPSNPDITGIGVRTAIYAQNFFSFIPVARVLWDQKITVAELDAMEQQSSTILITAFSILVAAIIQACTLGLSNLHAAVILNLSWMNNTNLAIYVLLYVYYRTERRKKRTINQSIGKEVKRTLKSLVIWIGVLHLALMAAFGIWFWSQPTTFSTSLSCSVSPALVILGQRVSLSSKGMQVWSLFVYSLALVPFLVMTALACFFLVPFLGRKFTQLRTRKPPVIPEQGGPGQEEAIERQEDPHQHGKKTQRDTKEHLPWKKITPTVLALVILAILDIIFLIDTELALRDNRPLLQQGDSFWTFGQTLALLLLLIPAHDFYELVRDRSTKRQKVKEWLIEASRQGNQARVEDLCDDEEPDDQTKGKTYAHIDKIHT
ncbi:hypothetical protein D9756_007288 [Leucocoprinus leucothites]|uniref:Uncharacterized protein n=1 Tax=Leucocoprinus leucothites TaxID=201217 RepID=A0A8H5D5K1_9AGAR|nr:hypothetical protein D9756_007288 [Leucoagaricus leucothites]